MAEMYHVVEFGGRNAIGFNCEIVAYTVHGPSDISPDHVHVTTNAGMEGEVPKSLLYATREEAESRRTELLVNHLFRLEEAAIRLKNQIYG